MFHFDTAAAQGPRLGLKGLLAAGLTVAALGMAAPASAAQDVYLQSAGMYNPQTVLVSTPAGSSVSFTNLDVYSGPIWFDGDRGVGAGGTPLNFLGFCVDLYHDISPGINGQGALNEQTTEQSLVYNGDGKALGSGAIHDITALVNIGTQLWDAAGNGNGPISGGVNGALSNELAAIQEDIWDVEGGTMSGGSSLQAFYLTEAHNSTADYAIQTVYNYDPSQKASGTRGGVQAFAFAVGVPEPATWGLMIVGFGGVGAALRRRRTATAFA